MTNSPNTERSGEVWDEWFASEDQQRDNLPDREQPEHFDQREELCPVKT